MGKGQGVCARDRHGVKADNTRGSGGAGKVSRKRETEAESRGGHWEGQSQGACRGRRGGHVPLQPAMPEGGALAADLDPGWHRPQPPIRQLGGGAPIRSPAALRQPPKQKR